VRHELENLCRVTPNLEPASRHLGGDLTIDLVAAFHVQDTETRRTLLPHRGASGERLEPIMRWTVACFCGNVYTAPPDQCSVCHRGLDRAATRETASAADTYSFAATIVTDADPRRRPRLRGSTPQTSISRLSSPPTHTWSTPSSAARASGAPCAAADRPSGRTVPTRTGLTFPDLRSRRWWPGRSSAGG
jgi:hypothetical protein